MHEFKFQLVNEKSSRGVKQKMTDVHNILNCARINVSDGALIKNKG
jgi:hypothetical protein